MQHGLLALAIALILAIVAALFAPAYVDWNEWRAGFERQASELAGTSVQIRGPIEATILPTPAFTLRDVRIGDPEQSTGIHAGEVQGTLSLGALLRGAFEAEDFALVSPSIRIAVENGGRIVLPGGGAKTSDALSISRFAISNGSLTIDDRGTQSLTFFDRVSAIGEMHSRTGPMRLDAAMRRDGRRWNLRVSTGVFGAEGARTRLALERPDDGASLEADGVLAFSAGLPRFSGRVNLAHAKNAGLPWKIAAQASSASAELVTFESFELTAGGNEFPLELSGNLQFVPRPGGKIEGEISAKRLDLDRALDVQPGEGLAVLLAPLRATLNRGAELPLKGRVGLAVDLLIANGAQAREIKGEIGFREGFLGIDNIEARLPGRAYMRAGGTGGSAGYFQGDVLLEAAEPAALVRWAFGPAQGEAFSDYASLRIAGRADWSPDRVLADRIELSLDETKLGGSFALLQKDGAPAALRTALTANGINLDLLVPFASALWTGSRGSEVAFGFQGQTLKLFGRELKRIDASVLRNADGVSIERLRVEDFDGLSGQVGGKLADKAPQPDGRITFDVSATRPGGLSAIARQFGGEDAGALAQKMLAGGMPLKLAGSASGEAKDVRVEAKGRLADVAASLHARIEKESLADARVTLEAAEAGRLLAMFGVVPGMPEPGDGRLELMLSPPKAGVYPLNANLSAPGMDVTASGHVQRTKEGRIEPRLQIKLEASDLRPSLAAVSRAGTNAVAAKGTANVSRSGDALAFENLLLEIAGTRAQGQVLLNGIDKPALSGRLTLDRLELSDLLALSAGRTGDVKNFWPAAKPGTAALAGASGSMEMEAAALGLTGAHVATDAKFRLKLGEPVEIANFSANYAGGKLAGDLRISSGKTITFDGRGSLNGFDLARALTPGTGKAQARGRGNLSLSLSGGGATPALIAANLSGQGTLSLENLEVDTLDPTAIATVVSAAEKHMPRDEGHLIQGVNAMLARAPLTLARLEAPLVAANGTLRTGKAITKTGEVDVTAEASADLARLLVDGTIEMETAGATSARPGVTVRWRGPFASPARTVDVSALSTAINLRAMERETKRLQERDRTALPVETPARETRNAQSDEDVTGAVAKLPKRAPLPPLRAQ